MGYIMKGSPAKLGTIQGTSGYKTALENASPNKGLFDSIIGTKEERTTKKIGRQTRRKIRKEGRSDKVENVQNLKTQITQAKADKGSKREQNLSTKLTSILGKKGDGIDSKSKIKNKSGKGMGEIWEMAIEMLGYGDILNKYKRIKRAFSTKDFDPNVESNKLPARKNQQNEFTGRTGGPFSPEASKYKTKKGDWMTVSQNLKKAKTDEKTEEYQELKDYFKTDGKPKRSELNKYMTKK